MSAAVNNATEQPGTPSSFQRAGRTPGSYDLAGHDTPYAYMHG